MRHGINCAQLRSVVRKAFGTNASFARCIGWSDSKVSALLNGRYVPDVEEASLISSALQLDLDGYASIFL